MRISDWSSYVCSSDRVGLEWSAPPEDVLKVIFAWVLLAWFGGALALLIGTMAFLSETVEKLWHPASYIIFPLSGSAFLVDAMPPAGQKVVLFLQIGRAHV